MAILARAATEEIDAIKRGKTARLSGITIKVGEQ